MFCRYCGAKLPAADAWFCSECGRRQTPGALTPANIPRPQQQSTLAARKTRHFLIAAIVGIALVLVGAGVVSGLAISGSLPFAQARATATDIPTETPITLTPTPLPPPGIGAVYGYNGVTATLEAVKVVANDNTLVVRPGFEMIAVTVLLENASTSVYIYSSGNFTVWGTPYVNGPNNQTPSVTDGLHRQFSTEAVLAAGSSDKGYMLFEVVPGDTTAFMTWMPYQSANAFDYQWALGPYI